MAADILLSNAFEDFQPDVASPTSGGKDSFGGRVKRILTSAVLLLVAYIIAFLLHQYATGLLCIVYGFHPVISYNHISNLPNDYREWTLWSITIIFSSGPLICLIVGIFFLDFFNSMSGRGTLLRCFTLWCSICFLNLFFSFLLVSPIAVENYSSNLYTGFSIVGAWWRFGRLMMIPLAFVALTGSILVGFLTGTMFLKFSFSKTLIETYSGRRNILFQLYLLPVLLAAPVVLFLSNDKSYLVHVSHLINLFLMSVGMMMGVENISKEMRVYGKDILNAIPVFWLALAGGLISLIVFVLES
ncbi:MAG: hypothetical protein SH857_11320 [Chitinophagales bacterium]|nr:hypothetical protein [Chitinophagales bacterium]